MMGKHQKRSERKRESGRGGGSDGKAACFKKGWIKRASDSSAKKTDRMERAREPERESGRAGWPLTRRHYRERDYGCSKLSKHSPKDPS